MYSVSLIKTLLCGGKEIRIIIFQKTFYILILINIFILMSLFTHTNYFNIANYIYKTSINCFNNLDLSGTIDFNSWLFAFIVMLVVSLVSIYSRLYIEHYNNKKFLTLIMLFFFSILILSTRRSFLNLIVGWDGLGVSSIFLIIFYPNKITKYNSILTMFFNRLGDVALIYVLRKSMISCTKIYFIWSNIQYPTLLFLLICSFTKRAQFPLSSWLPAAISAPTPISAIVHSSTLVTAGIVIFQNINYFIVNICVIEFLNSICILRFLIGGALAIIEVDFKKIIAFSTMRQIRLILFFSSMGIILIGYAHILYHAIFKTILFVSSGLIFLIRYGKQIKNLIYSNNRIIIINLMSIARIYSIRGLIFCSSFFSKDLFLEIFCVKDIRFIFEISILGRILTLFYSNKLINSNKFKMRILKVKNYKKFNFMFLLLFLILILNAGKLTKFVLALDYQVIFNGLDSIILLSLFIIAIIINLKLEKSELVKISQNIFTIKDLFYSKMRILFKSNIVRASFYTDVIIFKKKNFSSNIQLIKENSFKAYDFILILIILIICCLKL